MPATTSAPAVAQHFTNRDPAARSTYSALLAAAREFGPVREDPKKTSIHLVRETAFAGVATRKTGLILTLKSARDIKSPRIVKHEQASANRWHLEIKLQSPAEVDRELRQWLRQAYQLAG